MQRHQSLWGGGERILALSGIGGRKDGWRRESESGPIRVARGLVWQYADALHTYGGRVSLI